MCLVEVRKSSVTKSSYEIELRKMTSHFELLTQKFLPKLFFELLTRLRKTSNPKLLSPTLNFYLSTFELVTQSWKMKKFTSSY